MKFARVLALSGALMGVGMIGIAATAQNSGGGNAAQPASAGAQAFKVDAVHSAVVFRIKHMNVSNFYGRFNTLAGSWTLDSASPEKSAMEFTIQAESVDSGNGKRDDHLRSPDFFNAKEFPTISFKSTKVTSKGENAYEVVGDLTLLGKTRPVTVALTHTGTATSQRGTRSGIEAVFSFKRTDFGMNYSTDSLSDEVTIMAGVSGVPAK